MKVMKSAAATAFAEIMFYWLIHAAVPKVVW